MRKLIDFVLSQRLITIALAVALCAAGVWSWQQLDIEAYPDISDIEVTVISQVQGLPAEEVEQQVTVPIERALNTVPGVIAKRSRTIFGLSVIRLTFADGTDIYRARQLVNEKLADSEIPDGVKPTLGPMSPSIGEIFRYVIEAPDSVSLTILRELQDYVVIPNLLQAQGVVDIANFGGLVRQFQIVINPLQLEKYSLSVLDISDAIQANNRNTGGNFLRIGASQMNIRGVGRIQRIDDIANIVIQNREGVPILIKDVAVVELGMLPPTGVLGYVDKTRVVAQQQGIEGIVLLRKFENPSRTVDNVYNQIKKLNNDLLPKGVQVKAFYDRTELVQLTLVTVAETLLQGTVVVLLLLTLLLGSWRGALISALAIPFSLLFAFVLMHAVGIPANLLSLGAIDFGIIVDASVVMVEALIRNIHNRKLLKQQFKVRDVVRDASSEVAVQILYAVGIIILAFLPLFTLQRVEGRLFSPMAYTLSFAIFGSLIYALTVVPVLSTWLFRATEHEAENAFWRVIQGGYAWVLKYILRKPVIATVGFLILLTGGFYQTSKMGTEFLPELDEGCVWIRVFLPAGISLQEARQYPDILRREVGKLDEVRGILTQLGRNDDGTDPYGPNRIEVLVQLRQPYNDWKNHTTKKAFVADLKKLIERILPGIAFTITQPIIDTTTENATGSSSDLAVFLNGSDIGLLRATGERVLALVRTIPGNSESSIEQENAQSQLVVEVDRASAARYGVNVADVNAVLEMAVGGFAVSELYEGERKFEISIRFTQESRKTPEDIGKIIIPSRTGLRVPLGQVARIRLSEGQTVIFRENSKRQIIVKTNIRGRDQGSFAAELGSKIENNVKLPEGYSYYLGGQFENLTRARGQFIFILPLTLLLILLVLFIFFGNNLRYALIVLTNIPISVIGGLLALQVRGINFNISAGVGLVSLLGISVMSGVLLVDFLNKSLASMQGTVELNQEVVKGAMIQFRPLFLVMLIAIIGLFPAALNTGIGSDVQRPLATVIIGGLFASLILGMLAIPLAYFLAMRKTFAAQNS